MKQKPVRKGGLKKFATSMNKRIALGGYKVKRLPRPYSSKVFKVK